MAAYVDDVREPIWGAEGKDPLTCLSYFNAIEWWSGGTMWVSDSSRGLSQEKLAELSELHRTYVSNVERGERNIGLLNVHRLAFALGMRPSELLASAERGASRECCPYKPPTT